MSRIEAVNPAQATGKAKELLDGVKSKLGMTPNLMRVMANSPAVLDAYLKFSGTLGSGSLPAKTREQIALAVGQANSCVYCLSAHSAIGKMVGLTADQILDSRRGSSAEPKTDAALRFARQLVDKRGLVSDADLDAVRNAGWDDGAIAEIVANVALNIFTNYFNHVAETEIDFPRAESIKQLQVAVSGYDAVAYFDGKAIAGDPAFSSVHNYSLYHFSSEANKQKFDADPEHFIPLYGGYCATAASEGKLFGVDPTNFKITGDKRLALFYRGAGGDTLPQWNENEAERRAAADKHWREGSFELHA